jgi:diguanylate cyclase (GGDEF)-like protein
VDSLLFLAAVAAIVVVVATVGAFRAGRRAGRAADLLSQLLEPHPIAHPVGISIGIPTGEAIGIPIGEARGVEAIVGGEGPQEDSWIPRGPWDEDQPCQPDQPDQPGQPDQSGHAVESVARPAPAEPAEPADPRPPGDRSAEQTRIPVLDLERLRTWLTKEDVRLGRLAVVSVELDNLAHVQERLGFAAGAHLLEAITIRLRTATRPRDVVAHVNQERFVLVCRDVPDEHAAQVLAERIAMGVAHPSVVLAGVAEVTASIGVALAVNLDERPESVLRRAITAGNHARALGGARIEISAGAPSPGFADGELASAIARDELRLHYLPIVSCATGRVAGFEALVRWEHPGRGLLLPHEFLPEAERTGAIVGLGAWVLDQACRQTAAWHHAGGATLKLDVNLSSRQFAEPALAAQVKQIVAETGLAAGSVWLEITEEALLRDRALSETVLGRLHDVGVGLVIDDFGTGASSLVALKRFPIDAVKIARTFVSDLGRDRDSDAICRAIVELAHSLGLGAIAEGVETLEQFAALRSLGCELAQGHLFGPARPADAFGPTPAATLGVVGAAGLD